MTYFFTQISPEQSHQELVPLQIAPDLLFPEIHKVTDGVNVDAG
jgi:hypothetical protein